MGERRMGMTLPCLLFALRSRRTYGTGWDIAHRTWVWTWTGHGRSEGNDGLCLFHFQRGLGGLDGWMAFGGGGHRRLLVAE
jgi:hypothetical protein